MTATTRQAADTLDEAPLATSGDSSHLNLYLIYRVALGVALLLLFLAIDRGPLGTHLPTVFMVAIHLYLLIAVVALIAYLRGVGASEKHGLLAMFTDIVLITIMMHASGGVQSGLGMLIAVSIALGSLGLVGRTALLFAALGTLAVLTERIYSQIVDAFAGTAYMQAGLLGTSFFAMALLAHRLGRRAAESEQLASQRGSDLANLAQLNDFVIQQMRAGILVVDDRQTIQFMNEAAWVLLGMPVAMRHHALDESSPPLAQQFRAWQSDPGTTQPDFRATSGGRDLRASFTPIGDGDYPGTLIVLEDTARLTAEAQQLKLASLGRLTAGIAHEIRNPLGAISHAAQLLDESPQLPTADRRMIEIIRHNSQRVNEVVESILKLSRQDNPHPKPLVLGPWLQDQLDDIRKMHGLDGDQLEQEIDPERTTVFADPGQLRQVIDVLCDNAVRHSGSDDARLNIRLVGGITPESGGPFLELRDNGPGIPAAAQGNLFEPFFTTRNEGTGLGLYIARQLCEANHIRLEHLSQPRGGSCFRLSFPNPKRSKML
ncbi:MAG: ATP-binding protein [Gammaproteobacteria bacterium]|nr:ATP-binding protein [Gammaproteobacteria bacterium]